jgi:putative aminopeptidase FrvX
VIETIRKLVEAYGPSGHEDQIRELILQEIDGLADEVHIDAMGSVIAWRRSGQDDATRVMLSAHMDEIGVMVTHADEKGFLRFTRIGGLNPATLIGNRVRFADGTIGTIGVEKRNDAKKVPTFEQLFVDVSDSDRRPKIGVGDAAGFTRNLVERGERLVAKSMDDRIGCAVQIEVMRRLKSSPHDVAFVFSVQEEVGLRGAQTAAYAVEPDLAIAVDVTLTGDTPKADTMEVALGKGPAIKVKDGGMLAAPEVRDLLVRTAKAAKIPYQMEVLLGGTTDAAAMQLVRAGVRAGCLSIPCRYVHTTSETVDRNDVENAVKLLVRVLEGPIKL